MTERKQNKIPGNTGSGNRRSSKMRQMKRRIRVLQISIILLMLIIAALSGILIYQLFGRRAAGSGTAGAGTASAALSSQTETIQADPIQADPSQGDAAQADAAQADAVPQDQIADLSPLDPQIHQSPQIIAVGEGLRETGVPGPCGQNGDGKEGIRILGIGRKKTDHLALRHVVPARDNGFHRGKELPDAGKDGLLLQA